MVWLYLMFLCACAPRQYSFPSMCHCVNKYTDSQWELWAQNDTSSQHNLHTGALRTRESEIRWCKCICLLLPSGKALPTLLGDVVNQAVCNSYNVPTSRGQCWVGCYTVWAQNRALSDFIKSNPEWSEWRTPSRFQTNSDKTYLGLTLWQPQSVHHFNKDCCLYNLQLQLIYRQWHKE